MQKRIIAIGLLAAAGLLGQWPETALAAKNHYDENNTSVVNEVGAFLLSDARLADSVRRVLDWPWPIGGTDIESLRDKKLGYGEISLLYGLSRETGHSVSELLHLRQDEKMGWGQIAHRYGVKVSDAHKRAESILDFAGLEREKDRLRDHLDKDEREHGRPDKDDWEEHGQAHQEKEQHHNNGHK